MRRGLRAMVPEEGSGCPLPRLPWATALQRLALVLLLAGAVVCCFLRDQLWGQPEPPARDMAELQLNHTGPRQDNRLRWRAGPALGRSFLNGPKLDDHGQLSIQHAGIYRLHIQVTLANCSSLTRAPRPPRATLTVGICTPATPSVSLLRLGFRGGCVAASQRLTPLARGDTLCANLTLPLLPSPNADETFFGVQLVRP